MLLHMDDKPKMLYFPQEILFEFSDKLLKKFAPDDAMFISYRQLLEFIDEWVGENFEEP